MPDAAITETAEALAALLTDAIGTLSKTYTVTRTYYPEADTKKITVADGVKLLVLALAQSADDYSRTAKEYTVTLKVAVYAKVSIDNQTNDMDEMVYFVQQVLDLLVTNKRLGGSLLVPPIGNTPTYDPAELKENNLFVSVLALTYRLQRQAA